MSAQVRPKPGAVRPYEFPAVHHHVLSSGMRLVVVPMPRLPLVSVLALVDAGAAGETNAAAGVAQLTARTLVEGTVSLDGAALTSRFEGLGTSLGAGADWDSSSVRFSVTRSRLAEAFALFAESLRTPAFAEREVVRLRDERLADLAQQIAEPRGLADQRFSGFVYAPSSRFARPVGGTVSSVRALDQDAVRQFHSTHYGAATTTLLFVGDITVQDAAALAEAEFSRWTGAATAAPGIAAQAASTARRTVIVEKSGAPQSELRVGHVGVPRDHPDHLAIVVMNAILGGLFSSRINLNLREKHAFTYGASSGFDWRRAAGPFAVRTAVKTEVTARAVEEILREIDAMRATAPSADDVTLATDYLAGVFPIRFESTDAVAGALASALTFGLGPDWFLRYRDRVRAIGPAEVHAAARAHLDPSRLLVLAVGDGDAITEPLAALAVGPLTRHASDADPAEAT
ncbi:MAG: M16 family metallopeptidase [Gemmatimonadaceae bacterium]